MLELFLAITMGFVGLGAIVLTLVGLPGLWAYLLIALGAQWALSPESPFSWWTIGAALVVCVLAEVAEFLSGTLGAAKAGASKRALAGATVGGLIGAIAGTIFLAFLPIIGTLVGGAAGAAIGAILLEVSKPAELRTSTSVLAVGSGAAIGRLLSTVIKSAFAVVLVILLTTAAAVP